MRHSDPMATTPGAADPSSAGRVRHPYGGEAATFDPLRLCVFATIAAIAWATGPFAVILFAGVGFAGYVRARRAGLTRSRCYLRDTRLVLTYLGLLAVAGVAGAVWAVHGWLT